MAEITKTQVKDLGLKREVFEALPYAVVGGTFDGSLDTPIAQDNQRVLLSHVVPSGQQLKLLFLRVATQETTGARFAIVQTNPTATGQTGAVEAYPVVGSVPQGVRDYPLLEAAGSEVIHGRLDQPIHVLEGSINFVLLGATPSPATAARYVLTWWGVQETPE